MTVNRIFIVNWTGNIKTVIQAKRFVVNWTGNIKRVIQGKRFIVKVQLSNLFINTYRNASINSAVVIKRTIIVTELPMEE